MEPSDFETLFRTSFITPLVTAKDPPPAKRIPFKIPMRIVERVINNCYSGDGTVHPADHLLFIHELCGLFKIAAITTEKCMRKLFTMSLKDGALDCYRLLKNADSFDWEGIVPLFHSKFYPLHEIHRDRNYIYNFWPHDGEIIAQAWGRLKSLILKCPIHEFPRDIIINTFYARLTLHDKDLVDASSNGSFTSNKEEVKGSNAIRKIGNMMKVENQV